MTEIKLENIILRRNNENKEVFVIEQQVRLKDLLAGKNLHSGLEICFLNVYSTMDNFDFDRFNKLEFYLVSGNSKNGLSVSEDQLDYKSTIRRGIIFSSLATLTSAYGAYLNGVEGAAIGGLLGFAMPYALDHLLARDKTNAPNKKSIERYRNKIIYGKDFHFMFPNHPYFRYLTFYFGTAEYMQRCLIDLKRNEKESKNVLLDIRRRKGETNDLRVFGFLSRVEELMVAEKAVSQVYNKVEYDSHFSRYRNLNPAFPFFDNVGIGDILIHFNKGKKKKKDLMGDVGDTFGREDLILSAENSNNLSYIIDCYKNMLKLGGGHKTASLIGKTELIVPFYIKERDRTRYIIGLITLDINDEDITFIKSIEHIGPNATQYNELIF